MSVMLMSVMMRSYGPRGSRRMASNPLLASITSVPPWTEVKSVPSRTARTKARAETESSTTKTRRIEVTEDTTAAPRRSNRVETAHLFFAPTLSPTRRFTSYALDFARTAMDRAPANATAGEPAAPAPTAAALVIGDEILSGKVHEANMPVLARALRELGILLRRVVVVMDDVETD